MEMVLRCDVTDRPGALARLAGAVSECGGDIQSVEVLEHDGGRALDDLVVAIDPADVARLVDRLEAMADVELVHAGPSRGDPGDAVSRLAIGFEALLDGSMSPDHAITTLLGGMLRARSVTLSATGEAPKAGRHTLVVPLEGDLIVVVRRDYPFTPTERHRAASVARAVRTVDLRGQALPESPSEVSSG